MYDWHTASIALSRLTHMNSPSDIVETNPQSLEIQRLCRRFEIAVSNFGQSCISMKANEKAFQAWFAASVIQEFGLSRVYREIHLKKHELFSLAKNVTMASSLSEGNELFPDVSVSWLPDIDARHSDTRAEFLKHAGDFLLKFAIISELKVTGSTSMATPVKAVERDILKLAVFAAAHQTRASDKEALNAALRTYMVIMDNFSKADGAFKPSYSATKLQPLFESFVGTWPENLRKPTLLVISHEGSHSRMRVYSDFTEDQFL